MQAEYRLKIGQNEFLLKFDVANVLDFFEKVSFYSNLPKTGPNGETDLKISHRTTKQGYNYYSLVSEQAGQEFKFGQPKEDPKSLFPKGWEPIYRGDSEGQQTQQGALPIPPPQQYQAPVTHTAPVPTAPPQQFQPPIAPPIQMPNPNYPGMVPPVQGPSAAAPAHVGIPATPPAAMAPPVGAPLNPAQATAANNVLARFGLAPKN